MGVIYFLHFLKWVESPPPIGGGGGPGWCAKHIKAIMNIGHAFLGVPKAISNILSAESKEHVMRVSRTWDSIVSLIPKGGEKIWGNLDWSPEEGHVCDSAKKTHQQHLDNNRKNENISEGGTSFRVQELTKYGRMISFGKAALEMD
ncbi:Phospholipid:diacylglycerol acyltransferase 1 [Forsythia ovata]|uniref:Phospholipid:diacylglycerol acyltransferase 1 n=1 Tax=Forsythia ovata TaxID=205694 RepID=A0ABD1TU84_9LAMI